MIRGAFLGVRVSDDLIARIDRIAAKLSLSARPVGAFATRSDVARKAIEVGLVEIEAELRHHEEGRRR